MNLNLKYYNRDGPSGTFEYLLYFMLNHLSNYVKNYYEFFYEMFLVHFKTGKKKVKILSFWTILHKFFTSYMLKIIALEMLLFLIYNISVNTTLLTKKFLKLWWKKHSFPKYVGYTHMNSHTQNFTCCYFKNSNYNKFEILRNHHLCLSW